VVKSKKFPLLFLIIEENKIIRAKRDILRKIEFLILLYLIPKLFFRDSKLLRILLYFIYTIIVSKHLDKFYARYSVLAIYIVHDPYHIVLQ